MDREAEREPIFHLAWSIAKDKPGETPTTQMTPRRGEKRPRHMNPFGHTFRLAGSPRVPGLNFLSSFDISERNFFPRWGGGGGLHVHLVHLPSAYAPDISLNFLTLQQNKTKNLNAHFNKLPQMKLLLP